MCVRYLDIPSLPIFPRHLDRRGGIESQLESQGHCRICDPDHIQRSGLALAYDEASGDGCFVNSHDEVPLTNSPIQVLIVDDYEPWRRFASSTFQKMPGLQVVGEVSDGLQAVQKSEELQPDLVLLDIALPTINGIEAARQIRKHSPRSKSFSLAKNALQTSQKKPCVRALLATYSSQTPQENCYPQFR